MWYIKLKKKNSLILEEFFYIWNQNLKCLFPGMQVKSKLI